MISHIISIVPFGYGGRIVEVEGDAKTGLPSFNIVGMADKTVREATERVRSAIHSSNLIFPPTKIVINLAPAELAKEGSFLDLPIALSILILSHQLSQKDTDGKAFVGELSLDGHLRPVRGIINIVEKAKAAGIKEIFLPLENLPQASLVPGVKIYPVKTLLELILALKHQKHLSPGRAAKISPSPENPPILLEQIRGQETAKRALSIAIAGHHNILLSGPPGTGKTLLAEAAAGLLPPLSSEERISVTKLYSLADANKKVVSNRPFRSPHHTCTLPALIGGGSPIRPGEISLAHLGILFLDEFPEYPRQVLESLRQPLESHYITLARTNQKCTYPADFMLIATMNPCPCGFYDDPNHECTCSANDIKRYQRKLSGPLLDRIDIRATVSRPKTSDLLSLNKSIAQDPSFSTSVVKNTITEVASRQAQRYGSEHIFNSSLSPKQISEHIKLDSRTKDLLSVACDRLDLSARSYFKVLKVARTIADFENSDEVLPEHITEALSYR